MKIFNVLFLAFGLALLCQISSAYRNTYNTELRSTPNTATSRTALDLLKQKLCVCPCGNPRGGKVYFVPNLRLNWFEAVSYCDSIGMSIVSIKDANERNLLQLHLQSLRINTRYGSPSSTPYWIGANNLAAKRGVRWGLTDQEVREVTQWGKGLAPANDLPEPFCVYIQGERMSWVPDSCGNEQRQFVCEY